jgi:hypothetical protein
MIGAEAGWLDALLSLAFFTLVCGVPVWVVGGLIQARSWDGRVARRLGPPSDPLTDQELESAITNRRCGFRIWNVLFGNFRFNQPTVTYPRARIVVLPGNLVLRVPRSGDYRFRNDNSTVQSVRRGFWLGWHRADGNIELLQVVAPGRRREFATALRRAGWSVQR